MEFEVKEKCCLCDVEVDTEDELEIHIGTSHPEIIVKEDAEEVIFESSTTEYVVFEKANLDILSDEDKENINTSNLDDGPHLDEVEDGAENQSGEKIIWTCNYCPKLYTRHTFLKRHIKSCHENDLKRQNKVSQGDVLKQKFVKTSQVCVKTRSRSFDRRVKNENSGIFSTIQLTPNLRSLANSIL